MIDPADTDQRIGALNADDLATDDIGLTHEIGDEGGGRRFVEIAWRTRLGDLAILHHDDPVGNSQRLILIMRDIDGSKAKPLLQLADFGADPAAKAGIEVGKRFIQQQHLRLQHQSAGDRDTLLLAAGKFGRKTVPHAGKADELQPLFRLFPRLCLAQPEDCRP